MNTLAILLSDTYKQIHNKIYPKGLDQLVSYWTPRRSMLKNQNKMVFFGLQAFIEEYLVDYFNKNFFELTAAEVEHTYKYSMDIQLGNNYDLEPIMKLHKLGYLPIQIRAIPEGTLVPMGIPCIEITNTHPDFAWVVQWIECILQVELWKPCAHATIANKNTKLIILEELQAKLHLKPSQIAIVEDTVKTLDYIRAHSDFVTVHVSSFME